MGELTNQGSLFYIKKGYWEDAEEHQDNFKEVIRQREKIRIPFLHQSPQLELRPRLILYLKNICMLKKFTHSCLHLAVYILDTFMDCHNIEKDKIWLLANVCLLIAAKFEESLNSVPKISQLNAIVPYRYTTIEYNMLELMVLNYFSWYIMFPTVPHYAYYFLQNTITENDMIMSNSTRRTLLFRLNDVLLEYLNQIIDNIHYMQDFKPSILAATIISASRIHIGLSMWNPELEKVTGYSKDEIHNNLLFTVMFNRYCRQTAHNRPFPLTQMMCTFKDNFCFSCNIISCPKCHFLVKICASNSYKNVNSLSTN